VTEAPLLPTEAPSPWAAGPPPERRPPLARRLAERSSTLLVLATLALALGAAAPTVLDAVSSRPPDAARRGIARVLRARGHAVARPSRSAHPAFSPGASPIGAGAARPRPLAHGLDPFAETPSPAEIDRVERESVSHGVALARTALELRAAPAADAEALATVAQGKLVVVLDERGAWTLVARPGADTTPGWVPSSDLARLR
jgi:hypothetical protein